jgi:hypothetical protein
VNGSGVRQADLPGAFRELRRLLTGGDKTRFDLQPKLHAEIQRPTDKVPLRCCGRVPQAQHQQLRLILARSPDEVPQVDLRLGGEEQHPSAWDAGSDVDVCSISGGQEPMGPKRVVLVGTSTVVLHLGFSLGPACKGLIRKRVRGVRVL